MNTLQSNSLRARSPSWKQLGLCAFATSALPHSLLHTSVLLFRIISDHIFVMSENDELLSRLGSLAGQINKHKAKHASGSLAHQHPSRPYVHRASQEPYPSHSNPYSSPPHTRGRGRGRGRGSPAVGHRNKTLILTQPASAQPTPVPKGIEDQTQELLEHPSPGWVTRRDRHMQLINASVYGKDSRARLQAAEDTRQVKLKKRQDREKMLLNQYLKSQAVFQAHQPRLGISNHVSPYQIDIGGLSYRVTPDGSRLQRLPSRLLLNPHQRSELIYSSEVEQDEIVTPPRVTVGGVVFLRSKNGNLWRSGILKAKRLASQLISSARNHGMRDFSDPSHYHDRSGATNTKTELCRFFTSTGKRLSTHPPADQT